MSNESECGFEGRAESSHLEVEDDGETRRPIHDHDGEERYELSLVLFSHSVSEPQLISCVFAHNLFQTALQVCAQDSPRLDRSQEC